MFLCNTVSVKVSEMSTKAFTVSETNTVLNGLSQCFSNNLMRDFIQEKKMFVLVPDKLINENI